MSLTTPMSIRSLQRKLYSKAKAEPAYRFDLLHDEILAHAYALCQCGSTRVDGMTFAPVEAIGLEEWLAEIRKDLVAKTYRPAPVRRVMIPKPGGGERPLGIPTIRGRVVQSANKLVLEPIFAADLDPAGHDCPSGLPETPFGQRNALFFALIAASVCSVMSHIATAALCLG